MEKAPQQACREQKALVIEEADLRKGHGRPFQRGTWGKADILLVEKEGGKAIVKDFGRKILPIRWYGRWQIRREASIYRRLSGIPGVPRYFGRIGKNAMAIEFIDGERISHWKRRELPPALFSRLWALIEAIHSRGIVHIDLRKRDNILIDERPNFVECRPECCVPERRNA